MGAEESDRVESGQCVGSESDLWVKIRQRVARMWDPSEWHPKPVSQPVQSYLQIEDP